MCGVPRRNDRRPRGVAATKSLPVVAIATHYTCSIAITWRTITHRSPSMACDAITDCEGRGDHRRCQNDQCQQQQSDNCPMVHSSSVLHNYVACLIGISFIPTWDIRIIPISRYPLDLVVKSYVSSSTAAVLSKALYYARELQSRDFSRDMAHIAQELGCLSFSLVLFPIQLVRQLTYGQGISRSFQESANLHSQFTRQCPEFERGILLAAGIRRKGELHGVTRDILAWDIL